MASAATAAQAGRARVVAGQGVMTMSRKHHGGRPVTRAQAPFAQAPFAQAPFALERVVEHVRHAAPRWIVDCTLGGGGHALALLESCPQARLLGIDRDPQAIAASHARLHAYTCPRAGVPARAVLVQARFSEAGAVMRDHGVAAAGAIIADLGVSSHQLDRPERGFSFRADGPLDMRMSAGEGDTALELLRGMKAPRLAEVLASLGEERRARAVARAIIEARPQTTGELAAVVRSVVRASADGIDPATRTFQALRMLVNRELDELEMLLDALPSWLDEGGVVAVVSFHSLEDRAVKRALRRHATACVCPPRLPQCRCGHVATMSMITRKAEMASPDEVRANPRARSAKLRVARRLPRAN